MSESVPAVRGGESALGWSYGAPFGCAAARASSALMAAGVARMSTTTISLPRPFIFTKGRLASALMVGRRGDAVMRPFYMGTDRTKARATLMEAGRGWPTFSSILSRVWHGRFQRFPRAEPGGA